jgi:hypothetical protein
MFVNLTNFFNSQSMLVQIIIIAVVGYIVYMIYVEFTKEKFINLIAPKCNNKHTNFKEIKVNYSYVKNNIRYLNINYQEGTSNKNIDIENRSIRFGNFAGDYKINGILAEEIFNLKHNTKSKNFYFTDICKV